jgi:hypothetical protein
MQIMSANLHPLIGRLLPLLRRFPVETMALPWEARTPRASRTQSLISISMFSRRRSFPMAKGPGSASKS